MKHFSNFLLLCAITSASPLRATVWQVGPAQIHTVPSAVSSLVADGDTVEIDAGLYLGDVAIWYANHLIIKGIGSERAHLEANGNHAEGKAIWVIKGDDCSVENIEFSGCKVPDQNGAGIRQEGKNLTLLNCFFHHNEMGILTSNDGVSDYLFESCEFAENGFGDGYSHNVYVGHAESLTMRFCYSHDAHAGHLVKSRAAHNFLFYNRLSGENGDGSYEIDLTNGGLALLVGNVIEQSQLSQNGGIIAFGLEGASNDLQQIALSHNTIVNNRFDGRFVSFSDATDLVKMGGNLFLGAGTLLQGNAVAIDTSHNIRRLSIADAQLADPGNYDFLPLAISPCVDAGALDFGDLMGFSLAPEQVYRHPLSHDERVMTGSLPDVGAYELEQTDFSVERLSGETGLRVFPNPVVSGGEATLVFDLPFSGEKQPVCVFDAWGKCAGKGIVHAGEITLPLRLENLPSGIYFIEVQGVGRTRLAVVR